MNNNFIEQPSINTFFATNINYPIQLIQTDIKYDRPTPTPLPISAEELSWVSLSGIPSLVPLEDKKNDVLNEIYQKARKDSLTKEELELLKDDLSKDQRKIRILIGEEHISTIIENNTDLATFCLQQSISSPYQEEYLGIISQGEVNNSPF